MARASAKRGNRPQSNARQRAQRDQPVAAKEASAKRNPSYEDQLFFTRLRRRAKWVFAALAVIFAVGFVVFGVGTGVSGGNIGDFLRDLFGGDGAEAASVADALDNVQDNPDDPEALRELANAYQAAGQTRDAATTLEQFVELQPNDPNALRQLATLYERQASLANQRASALLGQGIGQSFSAEAWTFPGTSGFLGALGENPIDDAVTNQRSASASAAGNEATRWLEKAVTAYERLVEADPSNTTALIQLAQTAASAGQTDAAIDAFERYLEVDPTGAYAEAAKRQLENLQGNEDVVTG
jgi:tetratricopeptide (TPR) repeat protein